MGSRGPGRAIGALKVDMGSEGPGRAIEGSLAPPRTLWPMGDGPVLLLGVSRRGAAPRAGWGAMLQDAAAVPAATAGIASGPVEPAAPVGRNTGMDQ